MRSYAANLMLRLQKRRQPWGIQERVAIGTQYRQCVLAFDGAIVALECSAMEATFIMLRSLLEARWYLQWTLQPTDDTRSRFYYVSSLRIEREYIRSALATASGVEVDRMQRRVQQIEEHLAEPHNRSFNEAFENLVAAKTSPIPREPNWHVPAGARTLADIAEQLGERDVYRTTYRFLSWFAHGSFMQFHTHAEGGLLRVEPVRRPDWYALTIQIAAAQMTRVLETMTTVFASEELPDYRRIKAERWDDAMSNPPNIQVVTEARHL